MDDRILRELQGINQSLKEIARALSSPGGFGTAAALRSLETTIRNKK